jgi:N-acyl amino acid synthase of PEP-CTERM/exosortase system
MIATLGDDVENCVQVREDDGRQAERLVDRFNSLFACIPAEKPNSIRSAFQVRYQVYCLENEFENPREHPDGLETDEFDQYSVHSILVRRPAGDVIGTVRLILPGNAPTESPATKVIRDCLSGRLPFPAATTAEVSRFSICKHQPHGKGELPRTLLRSSENDDRRYRHTGPLMSLGLIQGATRMALQHHMTHWCAIVEPKFLRMLDAMGIHFVPVGPLIEHHGIRQPCYCRIESVLNCVARERPAFWDVITDSGALGYERMYEGRRLIR